MQNYRLIYIVCLALNLLCAASPVVMGGVRFKILGKPARIFWVFNIAILVTEIVAAVYASKFGDNTDVYNVGTIVQTGMITLFFNYATPILMKRNVGIHISVIGMILGLMFLHSKFLHPYNYLLYFY